MKPILDTLWDARGAGLGFEERMEKGTADDRMVQVNVESNKGSPGGRTERRLQGNMAGNLCLLVARDDRMSVNLNTLLRPCLRFTSSVLYSSGE